MTNAEFYIAIVAYISFIISSLTGALGGMMLLATMALYFPLSIMIPLHSVIHLSGDMGRILPAVRHIAIRPTIRFCVFSMVGIGLGFWLYLNLNKTILLLIVSGYILVITWLSHQLVSKMAAIGYEWLGLFMGYISVTIGAPGPLHLARIQADYDKAVVIVTTAAVFTAFINVIKIPLFLISGFNFIEYKNLLLIGSISAVLGSLTGVVIRTKFKGAFNNKLIIKIAISFASLMILFKVLVLWE